MINIKYLSFISFSIVFFFGAINDLLIAYYKPNLIFFDFYPMVLAIFTFFCISKARLDYEELLYLFIISFFFMFILMTVLSSPIVVDEDGNSTISVNFFFLRKAISYVCLGILFQFYFYELKKSHSVYMFVFLILIFTYLVDWKLLKLDTLSYPNTSMWGNYHYLSECLAVLSFLTIAKYSNIKIHFILSILTIVYLFLLGSRSTLFVYIITISFFYLLNYGWKTLLKIFVSLFILFILLNNSGILSGFIEKHFRMFAVLSSTGEGSAVTREILLEKGMRDIIDSPFLGNLGGQVFEGGTLWGGYIHDWRSYYRQFGLVPFLLFSIIIVVLNIKNYFYYKSNASEKALFGLLTLIFFSLEITLSRAYLSTYIFFFIGFSLLKRKSPKL